MKFGHDPVLVRHPVKSAAYRISSTKESFLNSRDSQSYHNAHEIELFELVVTPLFSETITLVLLRTIEQVEYGTLAQTWARNPV